MKAPSQTTAPSLIGASAGSGKTYRLTKVVTEAVAPGNEQPVNLPGLVAVTYTQKGAAELASRIRRSFAAGRRRARHHRTAPAPGRWLAQRMGHRRQHRPRLPGRRPP